MEYQSFGKPERSKGVNIKQALKVMLVLVVCTWMLYQIKNTRNKTENYGDRAKLAARYEAIPLWRKGISSRFDERGLPDSRNVDSVEDKESSEGRDDVYAGAKEDMAEEEFGHINKQFRTNEVELEPESQPEVSSKNRYTESFKDKSGEVYIESRRSEPGHIEDGNEQYGKSNDREKESQLRELPNDVPVRKNAKQYSSAKESDEDRDSRTQGMENEMQKNVVESATNAGVVEEIGEVESFHDENGVPPDGNDTDTVVGQVYILHEINFEG